MLYHAIGLSYGSRIYTMLCSLGDQFEIFGMVYACGPSIQPNFSLKEKSPHTYLLINYFFLSTYILIYDALFDTFKMFNTSLKSHYGLVQLLDGMVVK